DDARRPADVLNALHGIVGGNVDALQHRGQDRTGMQVVLVGVHADRILTGIGSSLEHTGASAASNLEDHIHALIELRTGNFGGLDRVVERFKAGADIGLDHFDVRVHGL